MAAETSLPIRWDITGEDAITQGADWIRYHGFDYVDEAGNVALWDLTGYTARMHIRASYDSDPVLVLTTELGRLEVGGGEWSLKMHIPASVSSGLADFGIGVYDVEVQDAFGHITRVLHGRAALSREVTR